MRRLKDLEQSDIFDWRSARLKVGQRKYGDFHLKRYGLVDVVEELLDAINILNLATDRWKHPNDKWAYYDLIIDYIYDLIQLCKEIDETLTDEECTDEKGGNRIWWDD